MDITKKDLAICVQNFNIISKDLQKEFLDLSVPLTFVVNNLDDYRQCNKKDKEFVTGLLLKPKCKIINIEGDLLKIKESFNNVINEYVFVTTCAVMFDAQKLNPKHIYICLAEQGENLYNNGIFIKTYNNLK